MNDSLVEITDNNFGAEVVKSESLVLVDFWAEWCAPCKAITPIIEELAQKYPDVKMGKCNVDESGDVATNLKISAIPTLMFFKDGAVVDQIVGVVPKQVIAHKLESLK